MTPNGEATEGVLTRLRKMDDLKPWGSIVYGPDGDKWGMSWNHASRRAAVDDARNNCGANKCPIELSFYGVAMRRVRDLGQILVADPARHRCSGPRKRRLTSAARLANLAALLARSVPTGPAARIFSSRDWKHLLMQNAVRRSIPILALLIPLACGSGLAHAQSGSAGGSIGNDEKSLSGSRAAPRSVKTRATQPARGGRTAPRRDARAAAAAATISMAPGSSAASA